MTREAIIKKTIKTMSTLPADKIEEVSDFADYVLKKHEEQLLVAQYDAFSFLNDEEDLYSVEDVIQ
jgi:hypothetical protein